MSDFFALLSLERRPLWDAEVLKERFHQLTAGQHPDVTGEGEGSFADLTVAYRTLSEPRTLLRHLLELEAPEISFRGVTAPAGVDAFFLEAGQLRQEYDGYQKRWRAAGSALARALLMPEQYELQDKLEDLLTRLNSEQARWLDKLPELDGRWMAGERPVSELAEVAQALGYLDKWTGQLRESLLTLQLQE